MQYAVSRRSCRDATVPADRSRGSYLYCLGRIYISQSVGRLSLNLRLVGRFGICNLRNMSQDVVYL